jgi:HK97 family phage major capsid protein
MTITKVYGNGAERTARFREVGPVDGSLPTLSKRERWKTLGDWFSCGPVNKNWHHALISKVPNAEASGEAGGYLVPEGLMVGVDACLAEESFFHRQACYQPMTATTMRYPSVNPAQGASGLSPLVGGFTMAWTQEATAPAVSNPTFQTIELVSRNLAGVGYASKQLIMDGGEPLGAYLENLFIKATKFFVTLACFQGNAADQPLGVIDGPATVTTARATALDIVEGDIEGMMAKLLPASFPNSWFACSPSAFGKLTSISGYNPVDVPPPFTRSLHNGSLRGRPIFVTECLKTVGTAGDLILFDPTQYVLGERLGIEVAFCDFEPTAWNTFSSAFRIWWRGDGQPLWRSSATIADGETTCSPYVILATKLV